MKNNKPGVEENAVGIETIAGQLVAMQMLLEAVIIDTIRSGALSSELMLKVLDQGVEKFPKNKNLTKSELFGALGVLTRAIQAVSVATTGKTD